MARRPARRRCASIWSRLESRRLFGGHGHDPSEPEILEILPPATYADAGGAGSGFTVASASPLSAVPLLSSRATAAAKLYLDFDGDTSSSWGAYSPGTTPAYDTDGDKTTFSDGEINAMREIWARVAEKFSPFNLDVTTINPGNLDNFKTLRAVIGGAGAWLGAQAGGVAYINSFTNSAPNTVWVFEDNLANGVAKYVAEVTAHEAAHGFGLHHQASWSGSTLTAEYNPGNSLVAPVMGNSYSSARGKWWHGPTSSSPTAVQDDMAVLSNTSNGFGYRADDHGSSIAAATTLTLSGTTVSASGVIERTSDADYFAFTTGGGTMSFSASPAEFGAMLDLRLELRDASGGILTSAATSSLGESITTNLPAGSFFINVASHGSYGDVGQYTLSGTFAPEAPPPAVAPAAPSELSAATASATQINLTWSDVEGETGYTIQRSADGSTAWTTIGTTAADITSFANTGLTAGTKYFYRVLADNDAGVSPASNIASATTTAISTTPGAPSNLVATAASKTSIRLTWTDSASNESGFYLERSNNGGATWSRIATLGANTATYTNTGLKKNTTYVYRIRAYNAQGTSAYSNTASTKTLAAQPVVAKAASNALASGVFSSQRIAFDELLAA